MRIFGKALEFFFSKHFTLIASIASILGLLIILIPNKNQAYFALAALVIFLLIILFRLFHITNTYFLQKTEDGYYHFATYVRYSTNDGKHIIYENHKYIQCKSFILDSHEHQFYWTGTQSPVISSEQQDFVEHIKGGENEMDKAVFKFKTPLIYNEFTVIHFKMDLNDSDNKSRKRCSTKIKNSRIQLLNFRIELKHLENNHDAKLMRKKINTQREQEFQIIRHIPFDTNSRTYEANVFGAEPGYLYKIEWE